MKGGFLALPFAIAACSLGFGENFSGGPEPNDGGFDSPATGSDPYTGLLDDLRFYDVEVKCG